MIGDTVERLNDVAKWFQYQKTTIAPENYGKRVEFLIKALDCHMELMALLIRDIQQATQHKSSNLWLPTGLRVEGDLRQHG